MCKTKILVFLILLFLSLTNVKIFSQKKRGIRAVDFRNFTYIPAGETSDSEIELRKGRAVDDAGQVSKLVSVQYADLNGDGREDAAVFITTQVFGSMGNYDDYYVFEYADGEAQRIFHLGVEVGRGMRVVGRTLLISEPFWTERDGQCCPSYMQTTTYRWRGAEFVKTSLRRNRIKKR